MRPLELTVRDFAAANEEATRLKVQERNLHCSTPTKVWDEDEHEEWFAPCWKLVGRAYADYCESCKRRHLVHERWRSARARRGSYLAAIVRRGKMLLGDEG